VNHGDPAVTCILGVSKWLHICTHIKHVGNAIPKFGAKSLGFEFAFLEGISAGFVEALSPFFAKSAD